MPALIVSLLVLVTFQLIGEFAARILGIPLPGALLGLVLLTVALVVLGGVPQALGRVGGGLLRNMMLLLAPAVVGLIDNMSRVREEWLPFLAACVAGALITLAVTAVVLQRLLRQAGAGQAQADGALPDGGAGGKA
ncbi:CidA/LrgA family protein [Diaphorobacter ruginosibacter]|uniref:CidA/LrgA family protein n=1 Tax=Diaphorobacter ruginosibacter TaxID=1715720 RepID=UPI003340FEEA